jgi:hypothetical protein
MTSDQQAAYAWQIRGLGGIINMIHREIVEGTPITPFWLECCEQELRRLNSAVEQLKAASNGKAAEPQG